MYHYAGCYWWWENLYTCGGMEHMKISVPSAQFCYKPKIAVKKWAYFK